MTTWLKQSTAAEIPIGPFVDATDGVTAETALTISQADVRLKKNDGDWAQKNETTAAAHEENGHYRCLLDTTDTNTLGRLRIAVSESGALPVWADFMVVPANVWDSLFGADKLQVDVVEWLGGTIATPTVAGVPEVDVTHLGGDAQSLADLKDFADAGYDPATNKVEGVKLVDTLTTYTGNTPQTGDSFARLGVPAGASVSADVAAVKGDSAAILADTGTDGVVVNTFTTPGKAEVQQEATDALNAYDPPTRAELTTDINSVLAELVTILADTNELQADWANGGRLDLLIDAIKAKTDLVPASPAAVGSAMTLAADSVNASALAANAIAEIKAALDTTAMTESYAADGAAPTKEQALFLIQQMLTELSFSGTTGTVKKLDGSTTAATLTINDAGTPTSITRSG